MRKTFGQETNGLKTRGIALAACLFFFFEGAACAASDVEVTGVVLEKNGEPVAIVNGEMVKVGDKVGSVEVVAIDGESVTMREDGKTRVMKIGEGAPDVKTPGTDAAAAHAPAGAAEGIYGTRGAVTPDEVASLTMSLFYDAGAVAGYIVFRDIKGEMRAVNFIEPAYMDIHKLSYVDRSGAHYAGQRERRIPIGRIDTSDFKYFRTKDGEVLLAYVLKPFHYQLGTDKRALVVFNWGKLYVQCEMGDLTKQPR